MYEIGNYILDLAMVTATIWIVKRFWGNFFEKRKWNVLSLSAWGIFAAFQFYFECNRGSIHLGMAVIHIAMMLLISICGYESVEKAKFFLLLIFCTVWLLIEILVFFFLDEISIRQEQSRILGVVISKILMILFVYVLPMVWKKEKENVIPVLYYLFLLMVPIGSIYIATNEFYRTKPTVWSMITISILLLFNVVIFQIYTKLSKIFLYERQQAVYAEQLSSIAKSTEEKEKMMEEFHEEKHNLINELIVLKNGIENGQKEVVIQDLNRIIKICNAAEIICKSGNSTIDAVINFKYVVAKEYGISFCTQIFVPGDLPIEQCDLGIVLGNAIDNAIEATRECRDKEKRIELAIGIKKEAFVLVIKNPYEHILRANKNGGYISTKKEKHRHGFGIHSIKKIAEKYEGDILIQTLDSIFSLTVVMNLKTV